MDELLPPQPGLYPSPILPDRQWDRVVAALRATGKKADADIARRIEASVQESRKRAVVRPVGAD